MRPSLCSCALLGTLALGSPTAADTPRSGFALAPLTYPGQGDIAILSSGDLVTFDGLTINRYSSNGFFLASLGSFSSFVFDGLFVVDPTETFLLLGESTNGDVFRVDLSGSGMTFLANLVFNFDAVFESPKSAIVSAATGGFSTDNDLIRLDTTTGATKAIGKLLGPSGPLVFDALGNLFYGSQNQFPAAPGTSEVIFFPAAKLASGAFLTDADAIVFSTGFDALSDLVRDPSTGAIYMSANDFFTGENRVYALSGTEASSPVIVEGTQGATIGVLEFVAGAGSGAFLAFQPDGGSRLSYVSTDFTSGVRRRADVRTARPAATLEGAGLAGQGVVTLRVTGGQPNGTLFLVFGPRSLFNPVEAVLMLPGLAPLHTGLDLATLQFVPFFLPLDAAGTVGFTFFNPGSLQGQLALQGVIGDSFGRTLGTSGAALL